MRDANFRPVTFCAEESDTEPVSGVPWPVEIHGHWSTRRQTAAVSPYNGTAEIDTLSKDSGPASLILPATNQHILPSLQPCSHALRIITCHILAVCIVAHKFLNLYNQISTSYYIFFKKQIKLRCVLLCNLHLSATCSGSE